VIGVFGCLKPPPPHAYERSWMCWFDISCQTRSTGTTGSSGQVGGTTFTTQLLVCQPLDPHAHAHIRVRAPPNCIAQRMYSCPPPLPQKCMGTDMCVFHSRHARHSLFCILLNFGVIIGEHAASPWTGSREECGQGGFLVLFVWHPRKQW
jgi:hypothetical protein